MKRVVITGASGYIGGALAKRLLSDGVTVYGVGRNLNKLKALERYGDFYPIAADFDEYDRLDALIPERGFDRFYHFAWNGTRTSDSYTHNDYAVQLHNAKVACDAAISAVRLECRNSSFSSSSYQETVTLTEKKSTLNPVYYGIAKRCAGELFKAVAYRNSMSCVNYILPNTYGINDKSGAVVIYFIRSLLNDTPLNLISGDYPDDWMPVSDIVDGIVAASRLTLKYGDYYIGHRTITTFREKLISMKSILGSSSELNWGKYPDNYYVDYNRFDLDALYNDTGWEAKTSFNDSILRIAECL